MRLALECPTRYLEMVQPFADFDWLLGHKFKEDKYLSWYQQTGQIKFLDNSVNEVGEPLSVKDLEDLSKEVPGCFIVSPDWCGKKEKTIEAYRECLEVFGRDKTVGVIQGESFSEAFECVDTYGPGFVAVPYDICSSKDTPPYIMALKRALVVSSIPKDRKIHLLGFVSLDEFFWYHGRPNVISIDTGMPVMMGMLGKDILEPVESKKSVTLSEMDKVEMSPKGWAGVCRNIALMRKFLP